MNWAVISTVLVAVHLVTEYAHYIIEFLWGRKDKNILKDILDHRKSSRKSEMLVEIVKDLRLIKEHLGIEREEIKMGDEYYKKLEEEYRKTLTQEQIDFNLEMIATEDEDSIKLFLEGLIPKNALIDLLTGKR